MNNPKTTASPTEPIKDKLIHAVTDYDRKQSTKPGHNPYALGIYFERVDAICADIDAGADPRAAIVAGFTGRLVASCLRELGLPPWTKADASISWDYRPKVARASEAGTYLV